MNRNTSCKLCFSLSVHSTQWPPNYLMVMAKLCMVINSKAGEVLFSLYFWTSTASQVWFQYQKKLLCWSQPKLLKLPSFNSEPAALGAFPGTKAISPHCSMDSTEHLGKGKSVYQLSQQQQETLHSLGVFLKPCQSTEEKLAGVWKAQGQQPQLSSVPPHPSLLPPWYQQH